MKRFLTRLIPAVLALVSLNAAAVTRYVDLNNPSPTPPYTSWPTAATKIQDAIDAAVASDLIMVTNGIYQTGGRIAGSLLPTNRVALTKAVILHSVNGPTVTTIKGYQMPEVINGTDSIRCLFLTNGSMVVGFTLTGGATLQGLGLTNLTYGGGAYSELGSTAILSNCIISANFAGSEGGGVYGCMTYNCTVSNNIAGTVGGGAAFCTMHNCTLSGNKAGTGGGVWYSTVNNCTISGNSATSDGGGGSYSQFNNCTVVGNSAPNGGGGGRYSTMRNCLVTGNVAHGAYGGGGAYMCTVINCTVVGNEISIFGNGRGGGTYAGSQINSIIYNNTKGNYKGGSFNACCTTPLPTSGAGNFTSPPVFVDQAMGDFHLQTNSPCINSGNNLLVTTSADMHGNPRITGGTVDIGAYELQSPASILSYAWAQQYGFPTDGSADSTDPDGDGMNNYGEWRSDTNPTSAISMLRILNTANGPSGVVVTWQSVPTRSYRLERATGFGQATPFQGIATDIGGDLETTTFIDTSATNAGPYFYRVGVQ